MNFTEAANEVVNWASNNVVGALMVAAVFSGAAAIAFVRLRDHFTPPTPTAFDDPKIKASLLTLFGGGHEQSIVGINWTTMSILLSMYVKGMHRRADNG